MNHQAHNQPTAEQLRQAREIGINLLEISFPVQYEDSTIDDFLFLLDSEVQFQTVYKIETEKESILNNLRSSYNSVPGRLRSNIAAVKLFDYPADYKPGFSDVARNIGNQLSEITDKSFFYQSAFLQPGITPGSLDFSAGRITSSVDSVLSEQPSVLFFDPSGTSSESLLALEHILNRTLSYSESIVIIPSGWFFRQVDKQKDFAVILTSYIEGNQVRFPIPQEQPDFPAVNWHIIFLLAIWIGFIIHYKYQPMYKSSLPRYFFNHSFFVADIMQYRIRNTSPGVIVLIFHSLLTGFLFYLAALIFLTETGTASLSYHFPAIIFQNFEMVCIFVIGVLIGLLSHIISLGWLYLFNKQLKQLNQVINLYSWPLHINLVIVTLLVYFLQINLSSVWLVATIIAYFVVWFISFNIAAVDGARYLEKYRALNVLLTVGLHFILIVAGIILLFTLPPLFEPLEMAVLLP